MKGGYFYNKEEGKRNWKNRGEDNIRIFYRWKKVESH
jgi:hypothetical protein